MADGGMEIYLNVLPIDITVNTPSGVRKWGGNYPTEHLTDSFTPINTPINTPPPPKNGVPYYLTPTFTSCTVHQAPDA